MTVSVGEHPRLVVLLLVALVVLLVASVIVVVLLVLLLVALVIVVVVLVVQNVVFASCVCAFGVTYSAGFACRLARVSLAQSGPGSRKVSMVSEGRLHMAASRFCSSRLPRRTFPPCELSSVSRWDQVCRVGVVCQACLGHFFYVLI